MFVRAKCKIYPIHAFGVQSLLKFCFVTDWVIVNIEQCSRVLSKIQTSLQFDYFWKFSYWRPFHSMNTNKTFILRGMIYSNFQEQRESRWPARVDGGHQTRWRNIGGRIFPVCRLLSWCYLEQGSQDHRSAQTCTGTCRAGVPHNDCSLYMANHTEKIRCYRSG